MICINNLLKRINQAFQVLIGNVALAKKDDLRFDVKWASFHENSDIVLLASEKFQKYVKTSKELVGLKLSFLIHEDDLDLRQRCYKASYEEFKRLGTNNYLTDAFCYRILRKDGVYSWVIETGIFTREANGDRIYIAFLIDVKQDDIALLRQHYDKYLYHEKKYMQFCETLQSPIVVLSKEKFIAGNQSALNIYEANSQEDFRNITLDKVMEISKGSILSLVDRALNGNKKNITFDYLKFDGTRIDLETYIYPLPHLDFLILVYDVVNVESADMSKANTRLYSRLFEYNPVPMVIVDYEAKVVQTANSAARNLYGYGDDFKPDIPIQQFMSYELDEFKISLDEIVKKGFAYINEQKHKHKNGDVFYVDLFIFPYVLKNKTLICSSVINVSEKVKDKQEVQKLDIALEYSPNFIIIVNKKLEIEYVNSTFLKRCGLKKEEVINHLISEFAADNIDTINEFLSKSIQTGNIKSSDMLCKDLNGKNFWVNMLSAPIKSKKEEIVGVVLVGEDLTLKHSYDSQIHKLKLHDDMTGLGNRQYIFNKLEDFFKLNEQKAILCIVDIDSLSTINESLGLNFGDMLIQITADRLNSVANNNDVLARIGNDEFALLHFIDKKDRDDMQACMKHLRENILNAFRQAVKINEVTLSYTISLGLVCLPYKNESKKPTNALRCAQLAMYQAKQYKGTCSYFEFSSQLKENANKKFDLRIKLKHALKQNQFELYYQSKVNLNTNKISGFEALIRWIDEDGNIISPLDFIPIAEESGLILEIGQWVIENACEQSVKFDKEYKGLKIAINLSVKQFQSKNFVQNVKHILEKTGANPCNIELEITESMLIENTQEALNCLHELKKLGVSLAIDDFGTGYSSFAYLKKMPIDVLKIDKTFIDTIPDNDKDCAIVSTIISLAKDLNMFIVAEGIETQRQAQFLKQNHCEYAQGYLYSKPLRANEAKQLLDR